MLFKELNKTDFSIAFLLSAFAKSSPIVLVNKSSLVIPSTLPNPFANSTTLSFASSTDKPSAIKSEAISDAGLTLNPI